MSDALMIAVLAVLITHAIVFSRRLGRVEAKLESINGNMPKRRTRKKEAAK